uniref:F-box domain-containing protein n=1 Tax=Caenorhabditis tropicalis TaxID=1561998 RepID=A0A1I7TAH9_9PELO
MNSKPLTYDSLKTVIQYLDPNTRFLISSRAPSIRVAEKAVPLIIDKLWIKVHQVSVNNISYECELYQVDCKDNLPYRISGVSRLNRKLTCNVDEFGTRDYINAAGGMLPGNNGNMESNLFGFYDLEVIPTNEGRMQKLEEIFKIEKQRLDQLINYRPKEEPNTDEITSFHKFKCIRTDPPRIYNEEELEILKNEEIVKMAIEYIKERIKEMENELILFQNKSKNIRPKFEIHLVKYQGNLSNVIERVKYTGNIHKAVENLLAFMFSKRRHVVRVNSFAMDRTCPVEIPDDLKMRIKSLNLYKNVSPILKILKPIIHEPSSTLEKLTLFIHPDEAENLDYEYIANSKLLLCDMLFTSSSSSLSSIIRSLRNQKVDFSFCTTQFLRSEDFILVIRNWLETNKPIGTCFTFPLYNSKDETVIRILNKFKNRFVNATAGIECVNIPMGSSAKLKISYFRNEPSILCLKMAVVPLD